MTFSRQKAWALLILDIMVIILVVLPVIIVAVPFLILGFVGTCLMGLARFLTTKLRF